MLCKERMGSDLEEREGNGPSLRRVGFKNVPDFM